MIIRKPYAFLIKNFKKIHIALLILSLFVAYCLFGVNNYVNEFMNYGVYDSYSDPITKHITVWCMLSIILIIIGSIAIGLLLRHKKKPWKVYLVPIIEYIALFFVLNMIKSFFNNYTTDIETTDLRMSRDLLMIFLFIQLPAIGIYAMRVFGLDIQKFNFNSDEEFLELSEEDREEVEININFDKNSFIRGYKRFIRNLGYFYQEHKIICKSLIIILVIVGLFNSYKYIFVTNKSYKEGQSYSVNGYNFVVNNTYFTDKDYNGEIISNKSNFIVVDISITNYSEARTLDLEYFHLKNGTEDYITTRTMYSTEFQDLGTTYEITKELKRDETLNCIIVFKVDKDLNKNNFVLYYQETGGNQKLRKIKLKVKDVSKIATNDELSLGDDFNINLYKKTDTVSFDYYEIEDNTTYDIKNCTTTGCQSFTNNLVTDGSYKILEIEFGSETYESKNMIDFLKKYGKIIYKDSNGTENTLDITNLISRSYYGKTVYLKVPNEIVDAQEIKFEFIVRNNKYVYKLT